MAAIRVELKNILIILDEENGDRVIVGEKLSVSLGNLSGIDEDEIGAVVFQIGDNGLRVAVLSDVNVSGKVLFDIMTKHGLAVHDLDLVKHDTEFNSKLNLRGIDVVLQMGCV